MPASYSGPSVSCQQHDTSPNAVAVPCPAQDNADLFAEDVEKTVVEQREQRQRVMANIPGMIPQVGAAAPGVGCATYACGGDVTLMPHRVHQNGGSVTAHMLDPWLT
mgnify:CR=1 FL=1